MDSDPVATSGASSSTGESTAAAGQGQRFSVAHSPTKREAESCKSVTSPTRMQSAHSSESATRVKSPVKRSSSSDVEPLAKRSKSNPSPAPQRRTSSRAIRRKRFDDEVVESSAAPPGKPPIIKAPPVAKVAPPPKAPAASTKTPSKSTGPKKGAASKKTATPAASTSAKSDTAGSNTTSTAASKTSSGSEKKPPPVKTTYRRVSKKIKAVKEVGRWLPADDLSLITAAQQTNDLNLVHIGVKFSCAFTLRDIQDRWHTLLYDAKASRLAMSRIRELHPEQQAAASSSVLWSTEEENLLGTVTLPPTGAPDPELSTFSTLLNQNRAVFHARRTPKALQYHFKQMRYNRLHPGMKVSDDDHIVMFSEAEEQLNDQELMELSTDPNREKELAAVDRQHKAAIRQLENELPKFQEMLEGSTGQMEMDQLTLAVLRGVNVRYLMRSQSMTIGRNTADRKVDVNLTLEGPAFKVSRRHATVQLQEDAHFYLTCEGQRAIYVNGQPILPLERARLHHNCIVEVCSLSFIFLIHVPVVHDFLAKLKESQISAAAASAAAAAAAASSATSAASGPGPSVAVLASNVGSETAGQLANANKDSPAEKSVATPSA